MYTNMEELKRKMADRGVSNEEMAKSLGINPSTFYRKLQRAGESFTVGQMHRIAEVLKLTKDEVSLIFLESVSQYCE